MFVYRHRVGILDSFFFINQDNTQLIRIILSEIENNFHYNLFIFFFFYCSDVISLAEKGFGLNE